MKDGIKKNWKTKKLSASRTKGRTPVRLAGFYFIGNGVPKVGYHKQARNLLGELVDGFLADA